MSYGIRTWNEHGEMTFDGVQRTILLQNVVYIPSNSTGSIAISQLPNGLEGIFFQPVAGLHNGVEPYTWVSGGQLHWRGSVGDYYLSVIGANY